MRDGGKENTGRKRGRKVVKVPHIHFNMKAIQEVKKRKRGIYKRRVKGKEAV